MFKKVLKLIQASNKHHKVQIYLKMRLKTVSADLYVLLGSSAALI